MNCFVLTVVFRVVSRKTGKQDQLRKVETLCDHGQVEDQIKAWADEISDYYIVVSKQVTTKSIEPK